MSWNIQFNTYIDGPSFDLLQSPTKLQPKLINNTNIFAVSANFTLIVESTNLRILLIQV